MGRWFRQVLAVAKLSVISIPQRVGPSLSAVLGVAGVVMVFVAVLSIGEGFRKVLESTGGPGRVIVLRAGTDTEMNSLLGRRSTLIVADGPGIARDGAGQALASSELFVIVDVPKKSTGLDANVPLRGISPEAFDVRGNVRIIAGRKFIPGRNELVVGRAAAAQFAGLDIGSRQSWGGNVWTVVGVFEAGGTQYESELWTDVRVLAPAYRRGNTYQSVYVKLNSEARFDDYKAALTSDPRLDVAVLPEREYYASQSRVLVGIINGLGGIITFLMALGAGFGAMNTMNAAISARTREIATLRALGFPASPVVVGIFLESIALCLAGGVLGATAAYFGFNGFQTSTMNFQSFSQVSFSFLVTPRLLFLAVLISTLVGLLGGILPAWRAARLPVTAALREA